MPENKERKGWCLFHDWVAVLNRLDKSAAWDVIRAIDQYYLTGNEPAEMVDSIEQQVIVVMMYQQIKRLEDVSAKRKKAGHKGGLAKGSKGKQKVAKDSKSKQSVATYTETNTNTNTNTEPSVHKYGQYDNVVLSDADLEKLRQEFPNDYQERIERLSEYMASSGKTYKKHIATIRTWARREKKDVIGEQEQGSFNTESFFNAAVDKAFAPYMQTTEEN